MSQSKIPSVVRKIIVTQQLDVTSAVNRTKNQLNKFHRLDSLKRIDLILNPITKS